MQPASTFKGTASAELWELDDKHVRQSIDKLHQASSGVLSAKRASAFVEAKFCKASESIWHSCGWSATDFLASAGGPGSRYGRNWFQVDFLFVAFKEIKFRKWIGNWPETIDINTWSHMRGGLTKSKWVWTTHLYLSITSSGFQKTVWNRSETGLKLGKVRNCKSSWLSMMN